MFINADVNNYYEISEQARDFPLCGLLEPLRKERHNQNDMTSLQRSPVVFMDKDKFLNALIDFEYIFLA
jgi:hypothetical protein